jgi:photosystem II stability/assembly factor-like uncharacterized protein
MRRVRRALFLSGAVAVTLLSLSVPAAANGRFPASNQLVFSPSDQNLMVLRTSYGLLPSHDNGSSWGYICEDALGLGTVAVEDPSVGLTANNSLIAGVSVGLNVSTDVGCNWNCQGGPLLAAPIADIAVRPDTPASAVAITRQYVQTDAAQEQTLSQIYETTDNGSTWSPIGTPIDPTIIVQTLDVTKGDPNRIYVSGTRSFGSNKTAVLLVSTDKGNTWTPLTLPAAQYDPSTEDSIYIGAIDPSNADTVYMRSSGLVTGGQSRLTVVTNASSAKPTFTTARIFDVEAGFSGESTGELLGLALSSDGSKVYVGTKEDGLWMASASDLKFTKKHDMVVQCLATRGTELWACSAEVSGFILGVSTDDGTTFTSKLPLLGALTGPIACAPNQGEAGIGCHASANSSECEPSYETFCGYYGCGIPEGGAGSSSGGSSGTGDAEGNPAPSSSTCNVSFVGICKCGGGAMFAGAVGIAAVAIRRRRRRRS